MEEALKEFERKGYEYRFKGNSIIFQKEITPNTTITFKYDTKERLLSPKRLVSVNDEGVIIQDKVISYTTNEALMFERLFNCKRAD